MQDEGTHPGLRFLPRIAAAGELRLTDSELLRRYVALRDEAAFEVLVQRHGALVWRVCRAVLQDPHAAEDAFQATFLILVKKGSSIGRPELLGNWLYGVAHRVALRARKTMTRQNAHEQQGAETAATPPVDSAGLDWPLLHGELQRLPAKYRSALVLCYLEGRTNEEAARQLQWPVGTLKVRLMRGREMLRLRLTRRGLTLSVAGLAAALSPNATAAPALVDATIRAAFSFAAGQVTGIAAFSAHAAALTNGVLKTMWWKKLKLVAAVLLTVGLLGTAAGVFTLRILAGDENAEKSGGPRTRPGEEEKPDNTRTQTPKSVKQGSLSPDALARHLGIFHASLELSFDKPPEKLIFVLDVYKDGKKTTKNRPFQQQALSGVPAVPQSKTQRCTVLYSRKQGNGDLEITVTTPTMTYSDVIEYPFSGPPLFYPPPKLDAQGRIILAGKSARKGDGGLIDLQDYIIEKAAEALVLQVTAK